MRSILNKLTPQMFSQLIKQVTDLTIDTEERLKGVIDLVFEKAIDEPSFSVAYSNMCSCLATVGYSTSCSYVTCLTISAICGSVAINVIKACCNPLIRPELPVRVYLFLCLILWFDLFSFFHFCPVKSAHGRQAH